MCMSYIRISYKILSFLRIYSGNDKSRFTVHIIYKHNVIHSVIVGRQHFLQSMFCIASEAGVY